MDNSSPSTSSQIDKNVCQRSKKSKPRSSPLYKETIITAVLQDLQDDVIDTPKSLNITSGNEIHKDRLPQSSSKQNQMNQNNNLYIQQRNYFKQIPKIDSESSAASVSYQSTNPRNSHTCDDCTYISIALNVQSWIRTFFTFIHGITAGLALAYIILVSSIEIRIKQFYENYSNLALMILSFFDFFTIICIVSIFDKIDFLHAFSKGDIRPEPIIRKWFNYLSLICYLLTLLLHQISIPFESILIKNEEDILLTTSLVNNINDYQINEWYYISLFKSIFLFVGWMLVAVYPTQEGVKRNFKILSKFCKDFKDNKSNKYW